jgi:hypothetical protein
VTPPLNKLSQPRQKQRKKRRKDVYFIIHVRLCICRIKSRMSSICSSHTFCVTNIITFIFLFLKAG